MNLIKKIRNNPQLIRFGIVGGVNTALDFGLLFICKALGVPVEVANIISTGLAFVFSFFANKKYTFKSTDTNVVREMVLFVIVTLTGLWGLQTIIITIAHNPLTLVIGNSDVALLVAKLLATIASLTWNYLFYSKLVFKKH
jgi:putative flippase GtrA